MTHRVVSDFFLCDSHTNGKAMSTLHVLLRTFSLCLCHRGNHTSYITLFNSIFSDVAEGGKGRKRHEKVIKSNRRRGQREKRNNSGECINGEDGEGKCVKSFGLVSTVPSLFMLSFKCEIMTISETTAMDFAVPVTHH